MGIAAQLLEHTGLRLAEIAARVGYKSEFAFSRPFARARLAHTGNPKMSDEDERADPGIRTIIALLSGRKANEAIDEGERKDRDANEAFDEDELGDREANEAIDEDEPEDRETSAISQFLQHPAPANPIKQKKTAKELAEMIRQDLSQLQGWPERGVKVTVYGFNPWNSMLTIGVEAGPVPRDDLQGLCDIITERLKRLYVIDAVPW